MVLALKDVQFCKDFESQGLQSPANRVLELLEGELAGFEAVWRRATHAGISLEVC